MKLQKDKKKDKKPKGALWTTPMRHTLCCLFRFFKCKTPSDKEGFEKTFSQIFSAHIMQCRRQDTLPFSTIYTQWAWMRRQRNAVWKHVHIDTDFCHDGDWKLVIQEIKSTASQLNIMLVERRSDTTFDASLFDDLNRSDNLAEYLESVPLSNTSSDAARASAQKDTADESCLEQMSSMITEDEIMPNNSTRRETDNVNDNQTDQSPSVDHHVDVALVHSNGKLCLWCFMEGKTLEDDDENLEMNQASESVLDVTDVDTGEGMPQISQSPMSSIEDSIAQKLPGHCTSELPLLYRWSNTESQGTNSTELLEAGMFQQRPEIFPPEALSEQSFLEHFTNHVTKAKVKTPFISTFAHPLAPVHRAIHEQKGAIVSVIDPSKVVTPIFKASKLVPITGTATYCWRGYGEFEIWGRVPAAAIVCTFPIVRLEAIRDQRIEEFLQLDVIRARRRCNSVLYKELANNLTPHQRDRYISTLKGLGKILGVREQYRDRVAEGFYETWVLSARFIAQFEGHRDLDDEGTTLLTPPEAAWNSDSDNTFRPQSSGSESSLGSTSSEEAESSTEVVETRFPRCDTPSDGFSVDDESSVCSGKQGMGNSAVQPRYRPKRGPVPLTPPSTGVSQKRQKTIPRGLGPIPFKPFPSKAPPARNREVIDPEEWPSDDTCMETPVRSRFFQFQGEEV